MTYAPAVARSRDTFGRAARALAIGAGAIAAARYLVVTWQTIGYPFHLEWMEGGQVETVSRLLSGQPIYGPPSVDWVGYVYPPVYHAVTAAVSIAVGPSLAVARGVSFVSFAVACALAYDYVRARTGARWLGAAAAGLLVATFGASGFWFHVARADSLCLALLLASLHVLVHGSRARSAVAAGLLGCAATLTKQTALVALVPVVLGLAASRPGRAVAAGGTLLGALLLGSVALTAATDGWFLYYALELPAQHDLAPAEATRWLAGELPALLPAVILSVAAVALRLRSAGRAGLVDAGVLAGFVGSSWLAFAHTGGYVNVLLPAFAAFAILVPTAVAEVRPPAWPRSLRHGLALAVPLQIALLWWPLSAAVPEPGATARGERFLAWLGAQDGEVLVPDQRFVQTRAGKRSHGLGMAARDVLRARPDDRGRRMLEESLAHAVSAQRFSVIVASQRDWLAGALDLFYEPAGEIEGPPPPVTGWRETPRYVFRPRPRHSGSQAPSQ